MVLVTADALYLHGLAIQEKAFILVHGDSTDTELNRLLIHHLTLSIAYHGNQPVQIGIIQ